MEKVALRTRPATTRAVAVAQPVEEAVEELEEGSDRAAAGRGFLEQHRRQRRAERERVDDREDHRDGDGERKLAVELAGHTAHERHGHEHRAEDQADGHNRPGHFLHREARGLDGFLAVLEMVLHGLDHHDGVIHHDADGEHEAEHGEHVYAEAERRKEDERAEQRDRHGAHGDDAWRGNFAGRCKPR